MIGRVTKSKVFALINIKIRVIEPHKFSFKKMLNKSNMYLSLVVNLQ